MDGFTRFSQDIKPAQVYQPAKDLWIITSFFNSQNYATKRDNYNKFILSLEKSGINYLVVECAFGDQPFTLPDSHQVLQVRAQSILWQKERLLNIATSHLPASCTKVAWVDCDVLFENESWAIETSRLLDYQAVVQPFDFAIRLPRGVSSYKGEGERWESFAAVYRQRPGELPAANFLEHGHTGFVWAARRDIITRHGLYDACISGSSDHLMAFTGDFRSACIDQMLRGNIFTRKHFLAWAEAIYADVAGKIGCVSGTLLHLWHGDTINRQYLKRNHEVADFNFNPYQDISLDAQGCWAWSGKQSSKGSLHKWAIAVDGARKEDG
jgi:hypothetical protein